MEQGIFVIAFGQVVVGDLGAQVMDVMKTDVAREPLQEQRQLVKGTALQAGLYKFPAFMPVPVGGVEVVLDVKEPDPNRGADYQDWQLYHEIHFPPDQPAHQGDHNHQQNIGRPDAGDLTPALCRRDAMAYKKDRQGREPQQDQGITRKAIEGLLPPWRSEIFSHRHRVHVTGAAPVEVASGGMMDRMVMFPAIVGCKVQKGGDPAKEIIGLLRLEERAVPAIVEDDKGPHQETRRQDRQPQRDPIGDLNAPDHQAPQNEIGDQRICHLPETTRQIGFCIFGDYRLPADMVRFR